jgi:hypothetical protein
MGPSPRGIAKEYGIALAMAQGVITRQCSGAYDTPTAG